MQNFIDMFMNSSILSKGIILILILISAYCWGIMYFKWRRFAKIRKESIKILKKVESLRASEILSINLTPRENPIVRLLNAVKSESTIEQIRDEQGFVSTRRILPDIEALKERLDAEMDVILADVESRVDFLATTATVAPYLGLLGTVLGITQSFWEIGTHSTANIAVVAPGLAEALITTIVGLIVAIPAAIGFNWLRGYLRELATDLQHFTKHFLVRLFKDKIR